MPVKVLLWAHLSLSGGALHVRTPDSDTLPAIGPVEIYSRRWNKLAFGYLTFNARFSTNRVPTPQANLTENK